MVPILLLNEKRPGKPQGTHSTHTTYYVKHRSTHLDVVCCGIPNNTHSLSMYDSTCTTYYSYIQLSAYKIRALYISISLWVLLHQNNLFHENWQKLTRHGSWYTCTYTYTLWNLTVYSLHTTNDNIYLTLSYILYYF